MVGCLILAQLGESCERALDSASINQVRLKIELQITSGKKLFNLFITNSIHPNGVPLNILAIWFILSFILDDIKLSQQLISDDEKKSRIGWPSPEISIFAIGMQSKVEP